MDEDDVKRILERCEAFMAGHFVYASGRHGAHYVDKDALFLSPRIANRLAWELAARAFRAEMPIQAVVGPAVGGAILAQQFASQYFDISGEEIPAAFVDKGKDGGAAFGIRPAYARALHGKNVLVVEDVLTTGASAARVVEAVRGCGGRIIGVAALVNRGSVTSAMVGDVPKLFALLSMELPSWLENECQLCVRGVPVNTDFGRGREFLARRAASRT